MTQIYVFIECLFCGICVGIIYDLFAFLNFFIKNRIFTAIKDFSLMAILFILFVITAVIFEFPSFRLYMFIGCVLGLLIYIKSFHSMLDFFINKVYNLIKRKCKRKKQNE